MRIAFFTLAAAASALTFAAPASAQWYPQPPGYAHGYYNHGAVQRLDARSEMLRRHVYNNYRRGLLSPAQARGLDREAVSLKQRIWRSARNGLSRSELRSLESRMYRLERRIQQQVVYNSRYRYQPRYYGYRW